MASIDSILSNYSLVVTHYLGNVGQNEISGFFWGGLEYRVAFLFFLLWGVQPILEIFG